MACTGANFLARDRVVPLSHTGKGSSSHSSKATKSLLQSEQWRCSMHASYLSQIRGTRVAPGCMNTFSSSHFLLLSPDCFTDELLRRWKWQLWAKPSGFNLWLFHLASGGSLSAPLSLVPQFYQSNPGEPRVLT